MYRTALTVKARSYICDTACVGVQCCESLSSNFCEFCCPVGTCKDEDGWIGG